MGTGDLVLNSSPCAEKTSSQSFLGAGVPALSDAIALQQYEFEKLLVDQQLWSSQLATEHEAKIKETAEQVKENASELKKLLKGGDDISPKLNVEESFHERYIQDLEAHSKSPPQPSKSVSRLSSPNKYKEERKGSKDHSPRGHIRNPRASSYHTRYDELKDRDSSSYRSGGTRMRSSHRDRDRGRRRSRSRSIGRGRGRSKDRHRGRDKGRSRSRSRSKVRHRGRDRGRSRSRSRSKDRHRGRDRGRSRSRSRSRSKDRQRERDGGRSRSRSRSKDRQKGRDRGRSRSKSRSRKGRRYCNEDASSGRPELLISQSRDSKCRIPPRITSNHIVARSSDADNKCLSPSNDVLRHSSTDLSTKENSLAHIVSTGEKNGAATAKQIEKEWIGVWNEKLTGESVKNSSTLRCPSNKLSGERITGEHNSKKSVTSKTTPVCRNSQTRDGKSFTTASRSVEMSGDSPTSIDHQPIREEGEIVGWIKDAIQVESGSSYVLSNIMFLLVNFFCKNAVAYVGRQEVVMADKLANFGRVGV